MSSVYDTLPAGIKVEVIKPGNGTNPPSGQSVNMHYTGTLTNGKVFDSSVTRGKPFSFVLGAGQVIRGWDLVVARMTYGEKVRATLPPSFAYGERGAGGVIPPNATLVFEMELLS